MSKHNQAKATAAMEISDKKKKQQVLLKTKEDISNDNKANIN